MRILIDNILLADAEPAAGLTLSSVSLNGERIVDETTFFRAAARTYFDRGGQGVQLSLGVTREFPSLRLAQRFVLTHHNTVPGQGLIECIVGAGADVESIYLEDAILQPQIVSLEGVAVGINYTIRGGRFSTDTPAEPLPSADPEEEEVSYRRGAPSIASAAEQVDVTFSSPLASPPTTVTPHVSHVTGDEAIDCELLQDTITEEGFSVKLTAPTPNGNYKLHYSAFL